jgi:hypothetical protein
VSDAAQTFLHIGPNFGTPLQLAVERGVSTIKPDARAAGFDVQGRLQT